jgi:diaminopimelate epimerase
MRFSKWHALGNSYILIERASAARPLDAKLVSRLCDPDRGVGSHGVLEVLHRAANEAEILIWNPDGSMAEMSGNGTRIAAAWLAGESRAERVAIITAGRRVEARIVAPGVIEQNLGAVVVGATETLLVGTLAVSLVPVDVGNPHAVVIDQPVTVDTLRAIGPTIETHRRFPQRTNVQLATPEGAHAVRALVWERGAGETPASGSSAAAVAAAAVTLGWCAGAVTVRMPGGELQVAIASGVARLTGPAKEIARGEISLSTTEEML